MVFVHRSPPIFHTSPFEVPLFYSLVYFLSLSPFRSCLFLIFWHPAKEAGPRANRWSGPHHTLWREHLHMPGMKHLYKWREDQRTDP